MIAYASRTGTRRNLAALAIRGWRLIVSARGVLRNEGMPYALDNGAWTAFQRSEPFDVPAFETAVARLGAGSDFIVVPDIVAGGLNSLRYSEAWLPRLDGIAPLLLAVQDGMTEKDVASLLSPSLGIFVGGSTEWKLATIMDWGRVAKKRRCYIHVGRVNSVRRIALCHAAGVHSFDGTSATRYMATVGKLDNARRQPDMFSHA